MEDGGSKPDRGAACDNFDLLLFSDDDEDTSSSLDEVTRKAHDKDEPMDITRIDDVEDAKHRLKAAIF